MVLYGITLKDANNLLQSLYHASMYYCDVSNMA